MHQLNKATPAIRAGTVNEIYKREGDWLFVDIGFSSTEKTCGVLMGGDSPTEITFSDAKKFVVQELQRSGSPLNLVIEAPLSATFSRYGNPTGRSFERRGRTTRYWYYGGAALLVVATGHLLRGVLDSVPNRPVRLFEGFVSFKSNRVPSSHAGDVMSLWNAILYPDQARIIVPPEKIAVRRTDRIESSLRFARMDFGIPPVVCP